MIRRTLLTVALVSSLACFANAQGQGEDAGPQGDTAATAQDVRALQDEIGNLKQRVADLETGMANLAQMAGKLDTIAAQLQGLDMDAIQALGAQVQELSVAMSQIATQSGDGYNVDILGKMNSSANFREEMRRATQGKIVFRNYTGLPQVVYINGAAWNVQTGESYIDSAVGNVIAQLAYFDLASKTYNNWQFENGEYRLVIDIR